jgi:hypothetical protein
MGGTPRPIGVCSVSKDASGNAEDVYQMFHNGLGSESTLQHPSDQWKSVAKEYGEHSSFLQSAIAKSRLSWEGSGAEAAHQNFQKLTQWHTAASNHASQVQTSMQTQATDFDGTKAKLKPKEDVPAEASWYEPWNWGDHDDAVEKNNGITQENNTHFAAYGTSTTHNSSSVPAVDAAPTDTGSAQVTSPSSVGSPGHGGGGGSYSPSASGGPGGPGGAGPGGPGGYSPGAGSGGPVPGYSPPPGSGGSDGSGWGSGTPADAHTGAPNTTSVSSYQPNPPFGGGLGPGGSGGFGPMGSGSGGDAMGGMPMVGGGMGGAGGQDSMRSGSGFGPRGSGMGAGAGEGSAGSGARSGAGMGGSAAAESAAARGGAAAKPGGGGPIGGGRGGKGEDDQEHKTASYLISEDNGSEIVGDLPLTAPPVIGE